MLLFEWTVALLLGAVLLAALARRVGAPYPALLALGGAALVGAARRAGVPVVWTVVRYAPDLADAGFFAVKVPALACFAGDPPPATLDWLFAVSMRMPSWAAAGCYRTLLCSDQLDALDAVTCPVNAALRSAGDMVTPARRARGTRGPPDRTDLTDLTAEGWTGGAWDRDRHRAGPSLLEPR